MANRCQSCNKLCALETQEPPEIEFDIDGTVVSASVRLVRTSECCGDDVKETSFEPNEEIDPVTFEGHIDLETLQPLTDDHELQVDEGDASITERNEGKGRGLKTFYGFEVSYTVRCSCDTSKALHEGSFKDDIQASHMEDVS